MSKRIIIPREEKTGVDSPIAKHFGRAPYFAVVDLDDNSTRLRCKSRD